MRADRGLERLRVFDALLLTSGIWFLAKFVRYAFPPLFETFQAAYGISPATLGLLFTVLMLGYAGMQFPSGALADRLGTVWVIAGGVVVLSIASLGLAITQEFPMLVAAMVLVGVGTGVHKTAAINLLGRAYPERTGRTLGTMDAIGSFGGVAAPAAVVAVLSSAAGWPVLFLAIAIAAIVFGIAFVRMAPRRLPSSHDGGRPAADRPSQDAAGMTTYLEILRRPRIAAFVLVVVTHSFAFNGLVAFLPLFLVSTKGLTTAPAGFLYATLFAVSLVQPVTGGLGDRFGRYPLMVATLGLAAVALAGLLIDGPILFLAPLIAVLGLGGHGFRPVRDTHLIVVLPTDAAGGSLGIVRTIMIGAGAVSPAIVGFIAELTTYFVAFLLLAGTLGLGAALVAGLAIVGRTTDPLG